MREFDEAEAEAKRRRLNYGESSNGGGQRRNKIAGSSNQDG
jgi:hypothetical protein